jgi:hypothetical protein
MALLGRIVAGGVGVHPASSEPEWFRGDHLFTPLERPRGLPIGNLTSQLFANIYLSPLDEFVKRSLGCRAYLRYMDLCAAAHKSIYVERHVMRRSGRSRPQVNGCFRLPRLRTAHNAEPSLCSQATR